MQRYNVGEPMERVAIDILGPLPESLKGNKYVLVITDYFTRWIEAFAMKDQEALTVVKILLEEFICRYGLSRQIHTDQGRQFEAILFQELCLRLNIDKTRTTPYRPQSDGLVERFNRTLEDLLSKYVSPTQRDWDEYLPLVMMAYRSSVHESTGQTPNFMMFGREVELPVDLLYGLPPDDNPDRELPLYLEMFIDKLHTVHQFAREHMIEVSKRQKKRYDHRANPQKYARGDPVWMHNPARVKGRSPKLHSPWEGPYLVVKVLSDVVYQIQSSPQAKPKVIHHDRLKPCYGTVENWLKPVEEVGATDNTDNSEDAELSSELVSETEELGRGQRRKRSPQRYRDQLE